MAVRSAPVDAALPGLSDRAGAAVPARRAWDGSRSVPPPGPHGGDGARVAEALGVDPGSILDLSQNLNPFAPDVAAVARQHLDALRRYPDPSAATRLLADAIGVRPERLVLTNGGAAAVAAVAAEIGGRVRSEPEFGLHPRGAGGPVWRSDPHNPSGVLAAAGETADVWDEAFYPLATGRWSAGRDGVVVGSLTKLFACPGLRLGYLIADDVERFARHVPEWAVGSLGLAVLAELLESADLPRWARQVASARAALADVFARRGWDVVSADAPWVLVRAPGLRERLALQGIVVRDCAGFGMPGHVRVAVPDSPGLDRLARALDRLSNGDSGS
ncbi:MAG: aminotransferase class I/II-fold pyridoxal phosphate-dependent enzyme [Acidimicrobiaceae bacterium]|nr:aminotransferase class I/II-fold pyridoxal phosphate-dependent enzyme [Acidimicrobiaceae bacterium]MYH43481.1 aminotransferase class I/II-fold pyridoxal phosphate-dependent enzyme [Acidimicrobiaceae bacterium]MYJ40926.1 aminotransferase class I/II-fold pyridoxal phosphate-dependent enzyme [Acidimicrobiaceae bacterium]